jgi:predicted enzyme related to lactoylglutathione lyase
MGRPNPVGWFEIYVNDLPRAKTFYEAVFQTQLTPLDSSDDLKMLAFPMERDHGGAGGALVWMKGMDAGHNSTIVYFMSEDCATEAGRVAGFGGTIFKDKFAIGEYGFIALAKDPDGNIFGIHSMQ